MTTVNPKRMASFMKAKLNHFLSHTFFPYAINAKNCAVNPNNLFIAHGYTTMRPLWIAGDVVRSGSCFIFTKSNTINLNGRPFWGNEAISFHKFRKLCFGCALYGSVFCLFELLFTLLAHIAREQYWILLRRVHTISSSHLYRYFL